MKLFGSAALLFLSAHAMTKQECMDNYPAGSAALGKCNKAADKMAKNMEKSSARAEKAENRDNRIAELAEFHARAQAQKINFRNLKDMTSDMQKIGQANKADGRGAKEEATMVFAENRKQALLQFAYKRMGFITDSHVCRKNGADVIIDNEVQSDTISSIDFMIQEDALTGKFWLLMKVDGAAELQSLDVSLFDSEGNGSWNAQQAQLAESKLNADNKNSQSDSDFWNVLVEDTVWYYKHVTKMSKMGF